MGLVLGPDGAPEAYTWAVRYHDKTVCSEQQRDGPELVWSRDVRWADVRWIALVPQYPGNVIHRCRVPEGAIARFVRRRISEGVVGGESRYIGTLHGMGWWKGTEAPTMVFVAPDGTPVWGVDDGTLTEET